MQHDNDAVQQVQNYQDRDRKDFNQDHHQRPSGEFDNPASSEYDLPKKEPRKPEPCEMEARIRKPELPSGMKNLGNSKCIVVTNQYPNSVLLQLYYSAVELTSKNCGTYLEF